MLRAIVGFGITKSAQRSSILDLSGNLPLIIELIDEKDRLRRFMAELTGIADIGLLTLEDIEVLHYGGRVQVSV